MSRYDRPSHRVFMTFFYRAGWQVQFTEADLKTPLPRQFTFADPEKIRELARRGEAWGDSESRQMLEYGIEVGRGGCYSAADATAVSEAEAVLMKLLKTPFCRNSSPKSSSYSIVLMKSSQKHYSSGEVENARHV